MENRIINIDVSDLEIIEKALDWKEGDSPQYRLGEDDVIVYSATFDDGYEMDIKVCGCQYERGNPSNNAWTEAVLFKNGTEVCCSDVSDEILGEWILQDGDRQFCVEVKKAIYVVNIWYSFDSESPAIIFDSEREALTYILRDYFNELRIAEEENNSPVNHHDMSPDGAYAQIEFADGEFMAWTLAKVTDKRTHRR